MFLKENEKKLPLQIEEIAKNLNLPKEYLGKILQTLSKANILSSHRGRERGFAFAKTPKNINLLEIVEAVEGKINLHETSCPLKGIYCIDDLHCKIRKLWNKAIVDFIDELKSISLDDLFKLGIKGCARKKH